MSLTPTGFWDEIASRYHPAYPPPHGGRSLSDSDKSMACNAAGRALLLNKRRSQCLLGNQTAACASLPARTSRRLSETCTAGTNFRHRSSWLSILAAIKARFPSLVKHTVQDSTFSQNHASSPHRVFVQSVLCAPFNPASPSVHAPRHRRWRGPRLPPE